MRPVVRLLGRVEFVARSGAAIRFGSERSRELLMLLALGGGTMRLRERIAATLWAEGTDERVRRSLNTEVWRLRKALAEAGEDPGEWIVSQGAGVAFNAGGAVEVDLLQFDALLAEAAQSIDAETRRSLLAAAVARYGGELAPGHYADWCLLAREAFRGRYLDALERLLELYRDVRQLPQAIDCARRILGEDPFLEHVHRELMRCHVLMGDRAAALRHYDHLRRTLRAELDVEPMPETQALAQLLRTDGSVAGLPRPAPPQAQPPDAALSAAQIRAVRRHLLSAARDLGAIARSLGDRSRHESPP